MDIPGIGTFTKDRKFNWYYSDEIPVKILDGRMCHLIIDGYDEDEHKADFITAINNFLSIDRSVLYEAEEYLFQYYMDCADYLDHEDESYFVIENANEVWAHIQFGHEPLIRRRVHGDKGIYISLECNCDWEPEHGLQIVFKHGKKVNKVGAYDDHLTNSDAYADESLEDVIYR